MILTLRIRLMNQRLRVKRLTAKTLLQPDHTTNVLRTTPVATRLVAWNKLVVAMAVWTVTMGPMRLTAPAEHVVPTITSAEAAIALSQAGAVILYTTAQIKMTNLVAHAVPMSSVVPVTALALKNAKGVMAKFTAGTHLTNKTVARVLLDVLAAIQAREYNAQKNVMI